MFQKSRYQNSAGSSFRKLFSQRQLEKGMDDKNTYHHLPYEEKVPPLNAHPHTQEVAKRNASGFSVSISDYSISDVVKMVRAFLASFCSQLFSRQVKTDMAEDSLGVENVPICETDEASEEDQNVPISETKELKKAQEVSRDSLIVSPPPPSSSWWVKNNQEAAEFGGVAPADPDNADFVSNREHNHKDLSFSSSSKSY